MSLAAMWLVIIVEVLDYGMRVCLKMNYEKWKLYKNSLILNIYRIFIFTEFILDFERII